jgi:prephenate dehydrogenase
MQSHLKTLIVMAVVQFLSYILVVASWRAIAKDQLPAALWIDGVYTTVQFFMIQRIAQSDQSVWAWLGPVAGGILAPVWA